MIGFALNGLQRTLDVAPRLISLFAGAGGLDLGLESAGFRTLVATDVDPIACETLRANQALDAIGASDFEAWFQGRLKQRCYLKAQDRDVQRLRARLRSAVGRRAALREATILERDLRQIDSRELLEHAQAEVGGIDLVAGGPPCQPFSRAGKRKTVDDDDGQLFLEFVRVVDEIQPRWFLFENVKGLAQTKTMVWWVDCLRCERSTFPPFDPQRSEPSGDAPVCAACKSSRTRWRIDRRAVGGSLDLILAEFERLGYRCDSRLLNAADYGLPQTRERLFIVGSRDGEEFSWPEQTHVRQIEGAGATALSPLPERASLSPWRSIYEALWRTGHPDYGDLDLSTAVLWVKNVVRPHDEPVTWPLTRPAPTVGAHQGAKLAIAPEGVPDAQLRRQQWHTRGRRQGDSPAVFVEHRYLSDQDLLTLQGFCASWYLHGTRMQRAFQIGNAVPPLLAQRVGSAIIASCGERAEALAA
jgi:DNA (cytosine-5)-methyltransferase 1